MRSLAVNAYIIQLYNSCKFDFYLSSKIPNNNARKNIENILNL